MADIRHTPRRIRWRVPGRNMYSLLWIWLWCTLLATALDNPLTRWGTSITIPTGAQTRVKTVSPLNYFSLIPMALADAAVPGANFVGDGCPVTPEEISTMANTSKPFLSFYKASDCAYDPAEAQECNWKCACHLLVGIYAAGAPRGFTIRQIVHEMSVQQSQNCVLENVNTLTSPPLNIPLQEIGEMSFQCDEFPELATQCADDWFRNVYTPAQKLTAMMGSDANGNACECTLNNPASPPNLPSEHDAGVVNITQSLHTPQSSSTGSKFSIVNLKRTFGEAENIVLAVVLLSIFVSVLIGGIVETVLWTWPACSPCPLSRLDSHGRGQTVEVNAAELLNSTAEAVPPLVFLHISCSVVQHSTYMWTSTTAQDISSLSHQDQWCEEVSPDQASDKSRLCCPRSRSLLDLSMGSSHQQPASVEESGNLRSRTSFLGGLGAAASTVKTILDNVSGEFYAGELTAIMGPSGSGKSTLMKLVAGDDSVARARSWLGRGRVTLQGSVALDARVPCSRFRRVVAFMSQEDSGLIDWLTVKETVRFSAALRASFVHASAASLEASVVQVIQLMGLLHVQNNTIRTGPSGSGISGGERRRVSIAVELVVSPAVFLLDEPLSGLDSYTAEKIMTALRSYAHGSNSPAPLGRVVAMSIHQPSQATFLMFDKVMLLAKGNVIWRGEPVGAAAFVAPFFVRNTEGADLADAPQPAVADLLLRAVSEQHTLAPLLEQSRKAAATYKPAVICELAPNTSLSKKARPQCSMLTELRWLTWRSTWHILRNPSLLGAHLTTSVMLGVLIGLVFLNVTPDLEGFQNRMGCFFFAQVFFGFSCLSVHDTILAERAMYMREAGCCHYRALTYYLVKVTLDALFLRVVPAVTYGLVVYFLMDLQAGLDKVFIFLSGLSLFGIATAAMCTFIGQLAANVGVANLICILMLLLTNLFGGFLLNVETIPNYFIWAQYLSSFYYGLELLSVNELHGIALDFEVDDFTSVDNVEGDVYLNVLHFKKSNMSRDFVCLVILCVGWHLLSYLVLRIVHTPGQSILVTQEPISQAATDDVHVQEIELRESRQTIRGGVTEVTVVQAATPQELPTEVWGQP